MCRGFPHSVMMLTFFMLTFLSGCVCRNTETVASETSSMVWISTHRRWLSSQGSRVTWHHDTPLLKDPATGDFFLFFCVWIKLWMFCRVVLEVSNALLTLRLGSSHSHRYLVGMDADTWALEPTRHATLSTLSRKLRFAIQVFGAGHPAINYLLLLAIADDALGMARS